MTAYEQLLNRLDEFIRRYYKNRMIQGLLYVGSLLTFLYLLVISLEFLGHFGPAIRTFLFFGFIGTALFFFVNRIALPLFSMFKLGKRISYAQASSIIGKHFPDVDDKLLNTLQLHEQLESHAGSDLLQASITQRMKALTPVPFVKAIDTSNNKKYLRYFIPLAILFIGLFVITPSFILKPTDRLLRFNEVIAEEAPFTMILENDTLQVVENKDYTVRMRLEGKEIPDKVFLELNGQKFQMAKKNNLEFQYTVSGVTEDLQLVFHASGFHSDGYEIEVLKLPRLGTFQMELDYPDYLYKENSIIQNSGDLVVPEGTQITWKISAENTEQVEFITDEGKVAFQNENNAFIFAKQALANFSYQVLPTNSSGASVNPFNYKIAVIPDAYPNIQVSEERDSAQIQIMYFTGDILDDYGLTKLVFVGKPTRNGAPIGLPKTEVIPFEKGVTGDQFFHAVDFSSFNLQPGDEVQYYFEVWDNDGVHGAKSTRTTVRSFENPTDEELEKMLDEKSDNIKNNLESSIKEAEKLQKELKELERQLLEKKEMTWQDKKKLEDLLNRQKDLEKQVEEIQKQNEQRNQQQQNESLLEKQMQLEKIMNEMLSPELKEMMQELQRMMNELNKDEIRKELEKINESTEDLEKEMDRALEQFKQMEVQEKIEKVTEKLGELAEKQEKLANDENKSNEQKLKEQEQLNKAFDDLKQDLKEIEKLNNELENQEELPNTEELQKQIDQDQDNSKEQLQQNKKSNASKSQKSAADKMKEMQQQMQMEMESSEKEQQEEDMDALRALLENIITVSFDQEKLMQNVKSTQRNDPQFKILAQQQRKLKDDAKMIEDSLFALSKRVPEISATVNQEINAINANIERALKDFPDANIGKISANQQSAMTGFNNLALLLDDALQQMQMQMQSQSESKKSGKGKCNKPGGKGKSKSSASDLKKMQEGLQKQLEGLKKQGKNQGKNQGQQNSGGTEGNSKELAQMAARQAAIRKLMEEKANELNEDGSGAGNEMKQIAKEMEKLQRDIVNNQITEESIRRQNDIMIRLLKAEEAERVRDQDEERKSNEALDSPIGNPKKYQDYLKNKQKNIETLRSVSPHLKPYYREKAQRYFRISE
ncbi:MAG: hypothetical protein ACK5HD_08730 [Bacteroidota bacterium]|jgi:hypothetical protein